MSGDGWDRLDRYWLGSVIVGIIGDQGLMGSVAIVGISGNQLIRPT